MSYHLLIDGRLVPGALALDVINPATGCVFAVAPRSDVQQAELAIASAKRAFRDWKELDISMRRDLVERFCDAIEARVDEMDRVLTAEQGKPIGDARGEILYAVLMMRYFCGLDLGANILREDADERIIAQRYPLGVVVAITPWNFPILLLAVKIAPALIAGNVVIAKPSPTTPLSTLMLGEIAADILPAGVLQTLVDQNDIGPMLTAHSDVAKVSFTGSSATGKRIAMSVADTLKRFTLELGGNDAAIIMDDVDVAAIAPKLFANATMNAGQVCLATKRVYAPRAKIDEVCESLAELADNTVVGDGLQSGVTMGPVQNRTQFKKLQGYIAEARANGVIVAGGEPEEGGGFFVRPTIVRDLADSARLVREEQFGPVLPVLAYDDLDDAVARANDSEYGLGGTIWAGDVQRGIDLASRIESGTVWVNKELDLPFDVPFGGAKSSGIGVQHGLEGLHSYTQLRIINAAHSGTYSTQARASGVLPVSRTPS